MSDDDESRIEGAPAKRKRGRPPKSSQPRGSESSSPVVAKAVKVYVAKGKAVTSKRGILAAGDAVSDSDFDGGSERVAQLVESGYLEAR